jgi:hypothetical protein
MDAKNFTRIGKAISLYVPQIKEPYTYITPAPFARVPLKK